MTRAQYCDNCGERIDDENDPLVVDVGAWDHSVEQIDGMDGHEGSAKAHFCGDVECLERGRELKSKVVAIVEDVQADLPKGVNA